MRRIPFLLPVAVFAALAGFFVFRLALMNEGDTPDIVPSALIDKPAPDFDLPSLFAGAHGLKTADLKGKVTLVNFFASWCLPCHAEHSLLMALKGHGAIVAGIAYKDEPENVKSWFAKDGDPYDVIAADAAGRTALDFGVYGTPETYLIDRQGIIRFKQTGVLTPETVEKRLLPLIRKLSK